MPRAVVPPSKRENVRQRVRAHAISAERATVQSASRASDVIAALIDTKKAGVYFSDKLQLGGLAIAAWTAIREPLRVWTCSVSSGVTAALGKCGRPTILVDESMRRRTSDPAWLAEATLSVDLLFGELHSKGFTCGPIACLSSCNLSRGCGVEHFALSLDVELAESYWHAIFAESGAHAIDLDHGRNVARER